jgi:hypothetical protein
MPALGPPVAFARSAAGLVRGVVLEVAAGGGPAAGRAGARGVPDLGQVAELDPGIMPGGLKPVIAGTGGDRVDLDDQVRLPGGPGAEPPRSVPAGGPVLPCGSEGERGAVPARSAGRVSSAGRGGRVRGVRGVRGARPSGGCCCCGVGVRWRWFSGSGRAQPWPMAWPSWSVTVRHHVVFGFDADARARSRARSGSTGPIPPISPGWRRPDLVDM